MAEQFLASLSGQERALARMLREGRSLDQIAIDTALAFNGRYIGKMLNDGSGRISFWNELVKLHKEYERIRMLENFDSEQMVVAPGETKKAVLLTEHVNIVTAMEQLYMAVYVH